MKLENFDSVEAEPLEAAFACRAQMFWLTILNPFVRSGAVEARLRRNHEPGRKWIQRFGDDFFTDRGAIGIGRVDKIDSEFDGAAQNSNCFVSVFRRAPDSFARESHGAVSEAVDGEVAADSELSGFGCWK